MCRRKRSFRRGPSSEARTRRALKRARDAWGVVFFIWEFSAQDSHFNSNLSLLHPILTPEFFPSKNFPSLNKKCSALNSHFLPGIEKPPENQINKLIKISHISHFSKLPNIPLQLYTINLRTMHLLPNRLCFTTHDGKSATICHQQLEFSAQDSHFNFNISLPRPISETRFLSIQEFPLTKLEFSALNSHF